MKWLTGTIETDWFTILRESDYVPLFFRSIILEYFDNRLKLIDFIIKVDWN